MRSTIILCIFLSFLSFANSFRQFSFGRYFRSKPKLQPGRRTQPLTLKQRKEDTKETINSDYYVRVLNNMNEITREEWNNLLSSDSCPFLFYDWINGLEETKCAATNEGWQPLHLLLYKNVTNPEKIKDGTAENLNFEGSIIAAVPLYAKFHSYGEFIFDQSWANFAESALGVRYYPKLLSAIPFTPATGPRILLNPSISTPKTQTGPIDNSNESYTEEYDEIMKVISTFFKRFVLSYEFSSINVNFMLEKEKSFFVEQGYENRQTVQYRWENLNKNSNRTYQSFDDYLSCFKSKRRIKIKGERKKVYQEQGIKVIAVRGDDIIATKDFYLKMFQLYTTTVMKMWGSRYLSLNFFLYLHKAPMEFKKKLLFIVAYDPIKTDSADEDFCLDNVFAGTVNLISPTHFYGRYWGTFREAKNLHFEVCYYKAIEYCIENEIKYMEPGAGGGEFKFLRGFDPYIVNSVHWFKNPQLQKAIGDFLFEERQYNQETTDFLVDKSAVKKKEKKQED